MREPALPYMHQTFQVLFQMKPMANVNDAVRRLLATGGWLDRFDALIFSLPFVVAYLLLLHIS